MSAYEYKVVPFVGRMDTGDQGGAIKVAGQLQKLINDVAAQGWEFYRIDHVQIQVRLKYSGALLRAKVAYIGSDQVVFRRERQPV